MNKLSDEAILAGLRSSEKNVKDNALKQLYAQHYPIISAYITKNNGAEEEASDIFQDAIIVFYEKIRLGELDLNCSIQTYLYSICKNLWFNQLRSKKRLKRLDDEAETVEIPAESLSVLDVSERQAVLLQLIRQLGEDCEKVLTHYYFDRLRMKEIAIRMGLSGEQVAKNKKSACMKKLKSLVLDSPELQNILR